MLFRSKEGEDVDRAQDSLEALEAQRQELLQALEQEIQTIASQHDPQAIELETVALKPKKSDVEVRLVALAWVPAE